MSEEGKAFYVILGALILGAFYMLYYFIVVKKNRRFKLQQKLDEIRSTRKFKYSNSMTTMFVNETQYSGKNITIINGKVIIDGVDRTPDSKEITIRVEGNVDKLEVDYANKIDIIGDVGNIQNASGDIALTGNVKQSISSVSGNIKVGGDIGGNAEAVSGSIKANTIGGHVSTVSGDIKQSK